MPLIADPPEAAYQKALSPRMRLRILFHPAEHRWSALLVLAVVCGFLLFYGLSAGDLYRTESLRAIIAAEFLRSGNWIVPTLYGEPLFTKPPGMYAAIALCSLPLGEVTNWSARLPSAVAATGTVLLFYWYFARQLGRFGGLVAAVILPTSIMWLDKAPSAEIDMLQVAWVSASILFFLRALEAEEDKEARRQGDKETALSPCLPVSLSPCLSPWWLLSLLCMAGGFLTKWTAPAFFYGTVVPLLWWRGRLRLLLGRSHLVSLAVAAGVCLAWVAAAVYVTSWEVFSYTVSREGLMRVSPAHHDRPYPWLETLAQPFVILATNLPWSAFALLTLWPGFATHWDQRGRRLLQALHCWAWPSMLFWTVIPEHAVRHSSPLFPALSGLAAFVWVGWLTGRLRWPLSGVRARTVLVGFLVLWLAFKVAWVHGVIPQRNKNRQPQAKAEQLAALVPPGATLYLFTLKDEGIMFYYRRPVQRLRSPEQLLSSGEPVYCILTGPEWELYQAAWPAEAIASLKDQQGDPVVLVRVGGQVPMTASSVPEGVKVLTIGELTRAVKGVIEEAFPAVWVSGEVSNLKKHTSGHWYLTLKDAESQLDTVIYRGVNLRLRFDLRDGMKVIAFGRIIIYVPRGVYQLQVEKVQPEGIGPLELAFRQLKEKLSRLGCFDPRRKRPLPHFPRRVVLLASPTGASVRDMLEVLARRWPAVEVWVCPVPVQGEGAAQKIAEAVRWLNSFKGLDVLVIGRGGGSLEDLWAFNEECLAQAIFASHIPVVTGIGHETDLTIADLVADCRGLTPTHAATLVVPDRQELLQDLTDRESRLRSSLARRLELARQRLDELARRRSFRLPLERIRAGEQRLDDWNERLQRAVRLRLEQSRQQLEGQAARLDGLSPLNVLGRGYSLTRMAADQTVVRSSAQVRPGDRLLTILHNGSVVSRVEEAHDGRREPEAVQG